MLFRSTALKVSPQRAILHCCRSIIHVNACLKCHRSDDAETMLASILMQGQHVYHILGESLVHKRGGHLSSVREQARRF